MLMIMISVNTLLIVIPVFVCIALYTKIMWLFIQSTVYSICVCNLSTIHNTYLIVYTWCKVHEIGGPVNNNNDEFSVWKAIGFLDVCRGKDNIL